MSGEAEMVACFSVAADSIQNSGYSRDHEKELAEILLRDPKLVKFLCNLNAVGYEERKPKKGKAYWGRWGFILRVAPVAFWNLVDDQEKPYQLEVYDPTRCMWLEKVSFATKEEMLAFAYKYMEGKGYHFLKLETT